MIVGSPLQPQASPNSVNTPNRIVFNYNNGARYEGEGSGSTPNGIGKVIWKDGERYEGQFRDGKRTGTGTHTWNDGSKYVGEQVNGKFHGNGTYFSCGKSVTCRFVHDLPLGDASYLSNSLFLSLLTQKSDADFFATFSLGVMSDYLLKRGFSTLGNALDGALKRAIAGTRPDTRKIEIGKIRLSLQNFNQPVLMLIRTTIHAMGLQLTRTTKGFVLCEVFNSGDGLPKFHRVHPERDDKYQTVWKKLVPLRLFTEDLLEIFFKKFKNPDEVYQTIIDLPCVKNVPDPKSIIWQSKQKKKNCSLILVFVYLRNRMPQKAFTSFRRNLFIDCIRAVERSVMPDKKILRDLTQKQQKLTRKFKRLSSKNG